MATTAKTQDRIVYCRELDPDTVLHLSAQDDRYLVRRFDGGHPFSVPRDDVDGDAMHVCYRFLFDRPLTAEESEHPAEDEEYWAVRITEINAEVLPLVGAGTSG